jgi:hypothetical protein
MHHAGRVDRDERLANLHGDRDDLSGRELALRSEARRERLTQEELHHEIGRAIREMPVIEHLDHVRMPGETQRLGLASKSVGGDGVLRGRSA